MRIQGIIEKEYLSFKKYTRLVIVTPILLFFFIANSQNSEDG
jgi:hypothetical protein